jgi:hypothetical protein
LPASTRRPTHGDGSVRFVKETINPQVSSFLATRAGGEVVGSDQL